MEMLCYILYDVIYLCYIFASLVKHKKNIIFIYILYYMLLL